MKYVVDASVALKWVLVEHLSAQALRVRADFQRQLHELHAPDIFAAECGHGLARAERRGIVPVGRTAALLGDIGTTLPQLHDSVALLQRAAVLSSSLRLGFYDCLYLALAEREGCQFITADLKLVNSVRPVLSFVVDLGSLP